MIVIYWTKQIRTRPDIEQWIRLKFGLDNYTSVNRETPVGRELSGQEMEILRKAEAKGYIQIRRKDG